MTEVSLPRPIVRRPLPEVVIDRIWRFFTSVRAAIAEIAVLALLVLAGTLRGSSVPRWLADGVPVTEPLVDRWYAWDVFHSLAFMVNLAILAIAIAICTINRAPGIWRAIARPTVVTSHSFLNGAETSARFAADWDPGELAQALQGALTSRRYRVLVVTRGRDIHLYADKHRFARLGTFPFHLALILLLVGGIVGARFGFRETAFIIPEGSTRAVEHGTDLSVRLDAFTEAYREDGTAAEYRSDLVLLKDGQPVAQDSITVNHPLTHDNVVFYQAGFGQAVSLSVADSSGRLLYSDAVPLGTHQSIANPDAPAGLVELPVVNATLHVIAPDGDRFNAPDRDDLGLRGGQMFLQLRRHDRTPGQPMPEAIVNQGESVRLDGLSVTFERERRFTVLQVASNPGIPIFIAAALLLVGGLAITFYFPHRRIRGIISARGSGGTSQAVLAPLARRDWSGQRDFARTIASVEKRLGVSAIIRRPDGPSNNSHPSRHPTSPGTEE